MNEHQPLTGQIWQGFYLCKYAKRPEPELVNSTALMSRSHHISFVFNGIMGLIPCDSTADILDIQMKKLALGTKAAGIQKHNKSFIWGNWKKKLNGEPMYW